MYTAMQHELVLAMGGLDTHVAGASWRNATCSGPVHGHSHASADYAKDAFSTLINSQLHKWSFSFAMHAV